ncbi:hypothetical protein [Rhodanobacter lindaniclasticus]
MSGLPKLALARAVPSRRAWPLASSSSHTCAPSSATWRKASRRSSGDQVK